VHEGILVTAEIDTEYTGVCGRCLTDIAGLSKSSFRSSSGILGRSDRLRGSRRPRGS
jgi:uncharacterized protein